MNDNEMKNLSEKLVQNLEIVKNDYIHMKEERPFLIRKDVVAAELKDILQDENNLKENLLKYIDMLLKV